MNWKCRFRTQQQLGTNWIHELSSLIFRRKVSVKTREQGRNPSKMEQGSRRWTKTWVGAGKSSRRVCQVGWAQSIPCGHSGILVPLPEPVQCGFVSQRQSVSARKGERKEPRLFLNDYFQYLLIGWVNSNFSSTLHVWTYNMLNSVTPCTQL
jgi:hypothetical protein